VKLYLVAYNVVSAFGWAYVLALLVAHLTNVDASKIGLDVLTKPGTTSTSTLTTDPAGTLAAAVERVLALLFQYLPFLRPAPTTVEEQIAQRLPDAAQPLWERATTAFSAVGQQTAFVQSAAVLEVLHALFGWVRSPLPTTVMQVASRLFLVWGVADRFETVSDALTPHFSSQPRLTQSPASRRARTRCTLPWSSRGRRRR
jgi:very-long-chain (3R)-3-hydroxyacyl-CoA dehydratase